jgi:acetyltransferase-like isoleucine patch superfamily enzyme
LRALWWKTRLRAVQALDRFRLRRLMKAHPGLEIHPTATTNLAAARFRLDPGAVLRIGPRVDTERLPGQLVFHVEAGAEIEIGAGSWIRTEIEPVRLVAFQGARLVLGTDTWLNGCQLSAKTAIDVEEGAMIGPGTRIYDSNHAVDEERPAESRPIRIGEFTWIASDVTVLPGVEIGGHCVIGSRAVVTRSIPPHTIAHGSPARPAGSVGKRRAFM